MIEALLILIPLIITFSEKPHLFTKPVKLGKIVIIILLLAAAGTSLYNDHKTGEQQEHSTRTIDSLNVASKFLDAQVDTLKNENRAARKEYVDSMINYHKGITEILAQYGYKVDIVNNTLKKIDSLSIKEIPPTLTIMNPPIFDTINNELVIKYELDALGTNAHLLYYYYVYIAEKASPKGKDSIDHYLAEGGRNFTTIIASGTPSALVTFPLRINKNFKLGKNFFLAMEFNYKSKGNKRQTPLRKVYSCDIEKRKISEVNSYDFIAVAKYLKEKKIWTKFYDL